MGISVETLAAAKKYADKVAGSGSGSATPTIEDGSITAAKLSTDVKASIDNASAHIEDAVSDTDGAHGLRYYNGALQYNNNGTWVTLSIADLLI